MGESEDWYLEKYNKVNVSAIEGSIFARVLLRSLERQYKSNFGLEILEVGCNRGEHVKFVKNDWRLGSGSYLATDIRSLDRKLLNHFSNLGVTYEIQDVECLNLDENKFDRVVSTCLFHHLKDPYVAFKEVRRVTKIGGKIDILLPNDPGMVYLFLRRITTVRNARKLNLGAEEEFVHAIEHRNDFLSLLVLARRVFKNDQLKENGFPFYWNVYNLNAFTILSIVKKSE